MDFNIKKHINNLKENNKHTLEEKKIEVIIFKMFKIKNSFKFKLNNGIISFFEISSVLRTKIKLKKKEIIKELKKHNIYVRDII